MLMMSATILACCVVLGLALDMSIGEVRRCHPLVGFGNMANVIERRLNHPEASRWKGALAWCVTVLPLVCCTQVVMILAARFSLWLAPLLNVLLLYFCVGLRSLRDHNLPIQSALQQGDLDTARRLTSYIVSRDTAHADEEYLAKASVESVLENGCDAVFGTLFWFVLLGGAGAVLYRASNTLDAMWGYRNQRFLRFGCVAARIDDVMNWIPARLTALSYALLGQTRLALKCWRTQAPGWPSPNAGPVMSAGAGALGLALGGSARYDGVDEVRPPLGMGRTATAQDIQSAWRLVRNVSILWTGILVLVVFIMNGTSYA